MKKWICAGIACMSLALMLTGCGKGKGTESSTETTAESSVSESSESSEAVSEDLDKLAYAYDYDVDKLVKLGTYKGLPYTITDTSVTDEDVEEDIQNTLNMHAQPEQVKDKEVEEGDTVHIDFVGKIGGEEFEGGSSTDYALEIGSNSFIEGFEDGLIGHKPGEEVVLNLKFPSDYSNKDYAGKDVEFTVTINYIEGESIVPELTDEFVTGLGITDVSTVDQYREYIRKEMQTEKESAAQEARREELIREAVEQAEVSEYPEELVSQYKDSFISYYEQNAAYYGASIEDFLAQYGSYFGTSATSKEDLDKEAEEYGKDSTKNMLVIAAIAKKEGIEIDDAFYKEKLDEYVTQYGFQSTDDLEKQYGSRYLKQIMMNEEVIKCLEESAKGVEPESSQESETEAETAAK